MIYGKKVGLIRWPEKPSLSPAMHNAAFRELGLDWTYLSLPVPIESLKETVVNLRQNGFVGANVTIPHKEAVLPYMDELSPEAEAIGAVNTIVARDDGSLLGANTDAYGFLTDLQEHGIDPAKRSIAVLGAGGSAKAVVYSLLQNGCKNIAIYNRTPKNLFGVNTEQYPNRVEEDLIINCTPVDFDLNPTNGQVIYDLTYTRETRVPNIILGIGMLLHQGAKSFELWTGQRAPLQIMRHALMHQPIGSQTVMLKHTTF